MYMTTVAVRFWGRRPRSALNTTGASSASCTPGLDAAAGEIALLREDVHGDGLAVEAEHPLLRRLAHEESQHLLEEAVVAKVGHDHALAQIAHGRAGVVHLPGETAHDLAVRA